MPAQFAQVDVTFLVNQDGMLTVSAKEQRSGAQAQVTVRPAHGLTRDEVDELVNESIEHAEADFTTRRLIELRNKANADLRHTEKALAEAGAQLTPEEGDSISEATAALQSAIAGNDLEALQHALDAFAAATNPLATLRMNEVLRKALAGEDAATLDPKQL
jgi:molecular chaperone DnaK